MKAHKNFPLHTARCKPLAACVAVAFALAAPAAFAATVTVTNCNDAGAGSLRAAVPLAGEGGLVLLNQLTTADPGCAENSTITLSTGEIAVQQNNLTILGPSTNNGITIYHDSYTPAARIFDHTGTGVLKLDYLNITGGIYASSTGGAKGGCIYSKGSVYLLSSSVSGCKVYGQNQHAYGGGIYAIGDLTLQNGVVGVSRITGNTVTSSGGFTNFGGGAMVGGSFAANSSVISSNRADVARSSGGGLYLLGGGVNIANSTISGNFSAGYDGGLHITTTQPGLYTAKISNSTISGNYATGAVGGFESDESITLQNSTIAFNRAGSGDASSAAGLMVFASTASITADLQSSLLSNNTYKNGAGEAASDFGTKSANGHLLRVIGANDLIFAPTASVPPPNTRIGKCPLLGLLRNNGGPTQTQALYSTSPAIGAGNNFANLQFDQRGSPFARTRASGVTDIGAYEVQKNDIIFNAGFEGCP